MESISSDNIIIDLSKTETGYDLKYNIDGNIVNHRTQIDNETGQSKNVINDNITIDYEYSNDFNIQKGISYEGA